MKVRIVLGSLIVSVLLICSCQSLSTAPHPTWTPQPTYTPYPTWTPQPTATPYPTYTPYPTPSPVPTIDLSWLPPEDYCVPLRLYLEDMMIPLGYYQHHLLLWSRWQLRVNAGSVPDEAMWDRLAEFWVELNEISNLAVAISPPRDIRHGHELFLKVLQEHIRAVDLLYEYYKSNNERDRSDSNAALAQADALYRQFENEWSDVYLQPCVYYDIPEEE